VHRKTMQLETEETKAFPISSTTHDVRHQCQICEKSFAVSGQVLEPISQVHIIHNNEEDQSENSVKDDDDIDLEDGAEAGEELTGTESVPVKVKPTTRKAVSVQAEKLKHNYFHKLKCAH